MMKLYKYKGISSPSVGTDYRKVPVIVVPDQSLSLEEILTRFVKDEDLPVGHSVAYGEDEDMDNPLNVDLEKMGDADLVDKDEFRERLKEISDKYEVQEKAKAAKAAKEKADKDLEEEVSKRVKAREKPAGEPASA